MARNSYKDTYLRFKRTPTIGTGGISELRHQFVNDVGQVQDTSFEIFNSFLNYIYGDINEAFTEDGELSDKNNIETAEILIAICRKN